MSAVTGHTRPVPNEFSLRIVQQFKTANSFSSSPSSSSSSLLLCNREINGAMFLNDSWLASIFQCELSFSCSQSVILLRIFSTRARKTRNRDQFLAEELESVGEELQQQRFILRRWCVGKRCFCRPKYTGCTSMAEKQLWGCGNTSFDCLPLETSFPNCILSVGWSFVTSNHAKKA